MDDALFAPQAARDVDRLALLRNAARRRHTAIISSSPSEARGERNAPSFQRWLDGLHEALRSEVLMLLERLDLVSTNAITLGAQWLLVTERPMPGTFGCSLKLQEAIRAVELPLRLLVENMLTDAAFLRRVMPPVWQTRLDLWERGGQVEFENGGGNTVMAAIVGHFTVDELAREATGLPAEVWRLMHFVIFDHDGTRRAAPGDGAKKLRRACRDGQLKARSHMLERRDPEHYLPPEALEALLRLHYRDQTQLDTLRSKLDEYLRLPPEERSFADLPATGKGREGPFCKNAFFHSRDDLDWSDDWFRQNGA